MLICIYNEDMKVNGKLTMIPTPIGNLGDITLRSIDALKDADLICAEDTRVTGKLLAHLDIKKPLYRLDEQVMSSRIPHIIDRMVNGETIAYCSDAGMPGVSDPGMRLVLAARQAELDVEVLPGASAVTTAFVASGFDSTSFLFGGFLPRKQAEQRMLLESLRTLGSCLIFYESPKRLANSLESIASTFPYREVAVCRELTKVHEEVLRDSSPNVRDAFLQRAEAGNIKGEIAVVIGPPTEGEALNSANATKNEARETARRMAEEGLSAKDISKALSKQLGVPRNDAYAIAIDAAKRIDA